MNLSYRVLSHQPRQSHKNAHDYCLCDSLNYAATKISYRGYTALDRSQIGEIAAIGGLARRETKSWRKLSCLVSLPLKIKFCRGTVCEAITRLGCHQNLIIATMSSHLDNLCDSPVVDRA